MELSLPELLAGRATRIKNREYFPTSAYVEPFLNRVSKLTDDFRIQCQLPSQITYTQDGNINTEDITYNRVLIEAILPEEYKFNDDPHSAVIGMVYGIDVRKPVVKFFKGMERSACTNLCVFNSQMLSCQELEPETAVDYKPLEAIINKTDDIAKWFKLLSETSFNCRNNSFINESLGRWIRNCMSLSYDTRFGKTKLACSTPIDAYKLLFEKDDSDYFIGGESETSMYNVYNAFTQVLTNNMNKDFSSIFEKTLLVKDILNVQ